MHLDPTWHTPNATPSDWLCLKHLNFLVFHMLLLLWHGMDSSVELKIHISVNLRIKRVRKKSIQENEGPLPVSHIALNIEINIRMHYFPVPLVAYELTGHSARFSQYCHETQASLWDWNLNNIWRKRMTCTVSSKSNSTGSPFKTGAIWKL
jgi:hypothetical protein